MQCVRSVTLFSLIISLCLIAFKFSTCSNKQKIHKIWQHENMNARMLFIHVYSLLFTCMLIVYICMMLFKTSNTRCVTTGNVKFMFWPTFRQCLTERHINWFQFYQYNIIICKKSCLYFIKYSHVHVCANETKF